MNKLSALIFTIFSLTSFHYTFSFAPKKIDAQCHVGTIEQHEHFENYKYCVHENKKSKNKNVVYFFHGLGGNEMDWQKKDFAIKMRKYWEKNKLDAPLVVSISLGTQWFFIQKNDSSHSGLLEIFTHQILPQIESKLNKKIEKRTLLGISMGGSNLLSVLLNSPELFDKAAALCPVVSSLSPFASEEEIQNYIQKNKASPENVNRYIQISKLYFPDFESWQKVHPFEVVKNSVQYEGRNLKPLLLSIGETDEYGVFEDIKYLYDLYQEYDGEATWYPTQGKHCTFNLEKTAAFIH